MIKLALKRKGALIRKIACDFMAYQVTRTSKPLFKRLAVRFILLICKRLAVRLGYIYDIG